MNHRRVQDSRRMKDPQSHQARPVVEELRELRDIARREHGPRAISTKRIEEALAAEERKSRHASTKPDVKRTDRRP